MPVAEQDRRLVLLLNEKTLAKKLQWTESGRDGEFIARVTVLNGGNYAFTVAINRLTEMFNDKYSVKSPVTFQVLLPEGLEIAHIEVRPEDPDYAAARQVYDRASMQARRASDLIREVEGVLTGL